MCIIQQCMVLSVVHVMIIPPPEGPEYTFLIFIMLQCKRKDIDDHMETAKDSHQVLTLTGRIEKMEKVCNNYFDLRGNHTLTEIEHI